MARPTKQGIDYFPIDCQFDGKTEMYILEKEAPGLAVLVTLWQLIYQDEGYYIDDNKDLHLRIKKRINVDINEVNDCINVCLSRGIFDKSVHDKYSILTSKAIQKRFFDAAKRKKTLQYEVNYIINGINVCNNAINVPQQSLKGKGEGKGDVEVKEIKKNIYSRFFDEIWSKYPKRDGKRDALRHFNATVKSDKDVEDIGKALGNYLQSDTVKNGYVKNGSTWFNNWRDWIDNPVDNLKPKKWNEI